MQDHVEPFLAAEVTYRREQAMQWRRHHHDVAEARAARAARRARRGRRWPW